MKQCLHCSTPIHNKPHANNVKYCSASCREKHYTELHPFESRDYQRLRSNKHHLKQFRGATQCIICNLWFRAPCHHAWQIHEVNEAEYKRLAGIDHKKGIIPSELKEIKAEHVRTNGTILNLKKGKPTRYVKGDKKAGRYKRSPQTMERLKLLGRNLPHKRNG